MTAIICASCGATKMRRNADVARSLKAGAPIYCNRECAGVARRKGKTAAQKKSEKSAYDGEYRKRTRAKKKAYAAAWYQANKDRDAERQYRQRHMQRHVEYCRKPAYRAKKRTYDEKVRSSEYGPYAGCYRLLIELHAEIVKRVPSYYERHRETLLEKERMRKDAKRRECTAGRG